MPQRSKQLLLSFIISLFGTFAFFTIVSFCPFVLLFLCPLNLLPPCNFVLLFPCNFFLSFFFVLFYFYNCTNIYLCMWYLHSQDCCASCRRSCRCSCFQMSRRLPEIRALVSSVKKLLSYHSELKQEAPKNSSKSSPWPLCYPRYQAWSMG